jgi:4,5:9,10-diseco-3-hydroxy-5,9,17-trioxoandrosta-1(10),2-diene-4-oate hydrolase
MTRTTNQDNSERYQGSSRTKQEATMVIPQERYIKIGSINTRFLAEGEGSPVILVHGLGGSASGWLPSFGAIAARHRVYAMDLVGHGRTGQPDSGSLNAADMTGFVKDFMAEFKIERAHIVGHSMGGAISLQIAIDFPERVNKLVLVDSVGLGKEISILLRILSLPLVGEWLAAQDFKHNIKKYAAAVRKSAQNATYITDELIENLYQVERNPEQAVPLLKVLRLAANWTGQKKSVYGPILQRLPSIRNPTLVIWGRQDATIPLAHGELAAQTLPNARLEVIDHCGHIPMFEQPEIFNQLVLDFLKD